jgi:hypothetical protein
MQMPYNLIFILILLSYPNDNLDELIICKKIIILNVYIFEFSNLDKSIKYFGKLFWI